MGTPGHAPMQPERMIRGLLRSIGIDKAIAWTLVGRGFSVLAGPVTLLLVARFLSREEQGYYVTFASVLGLQIFFELGLSFVLLQFASHERARLQWDAGGRLTGDATAKARLASLIHLSVRWYGAVALLVIVCILPGGMAFFATHQAQDVLVVWKVPWTWLVFASAASLFLSPCFSILEGCGLVPQVAFVRVVGGMMGTLVLWLGLTIHVTLYAAAMSSTAIVLWQVAWLFVTKRTALTDLYASRRPDIVIGWRKEILPFQWKIAVSWLSGYFIFQLFNPVLFAYQGSVIAGQMGMSLTITGALSSMAMAWIATKSAPFGSLVAQRQYRDLDRVFFRSLWQSLALILLAGTAVWLCVYYLSLIHHPLAQRILEPLPFACLIGAAVVNHVVFGEAVYLRAHKQEPLLLLSVAGAFLTGGSTFLLGKYVGATAVAAAYCTLNIAFGLPIATWIFLKKRRQWHTA